jgi:hypothetical protein
VPEPQRIAHVVDVTLSDTTLSLFEDGVFSDQVRLAVSCQRRTRNHQRDRVQPGPFGYCGTRGRSVSGRGADGESGREIDKLDLVIVAGSLDEHEAVCCHPAEGWSRKVVDANCVVPARRRSCTTHRPSCGLVSWFNGRAAPSAMPAGTPTGFEPDLA